MVKNGHEEICPKCGKELTRIDWPYELGYEMCCFSCAYSKEIKYGGIKNEPDRENPNPFCVEGTS